jgi:hypothetical protein
MRRARLSGCSKLRFSGVSGDKKGPPRRALSFGERRSRANFLKFLAFLHGTRTATFRNFPVAWYPSRSLEFVGIHRMSVSPGSGNTHTLAQSQSLLDELVSPVAGATSRHRLRIISPIFLWPAPVAIHMNRSHCSTTCCAVSAQISRPRRAQNSQSALPGCTALHRSSSARSLLMMRLRWPGRCSSGRSN